MINWERNLPLDVYKRGETQKESWSIYNSKGKIRTYNLNVKLGKPLNLISLKQDVISNFRKRVAEIKKSRTELFQDKNTEEVLECPICSGKSEDSEFVLQLYGAKYHKCNQCSHMFVISRPSKQVLEKFYSKSEAYQATYSDKKTAELRVKEIAEPKLEWIIKQFKSCFGREPKSILDVGAGSGHFVYACKKKGIFAEGLELSKSGIDFAKEVFDVELKRLDFIENWDKFKDFDIITFWGVVEHVPNPSELVDAAHKALNKEDSMIVVEVPRWCCFSTEIQRIFPETIVRHLDPLGHINVFSDNSLATLLYQNNFAPFAAWYFGMDSYELFVQLNNLVDNGPDLEVIKRDIPKLQKVFDINRFSDEIVLAARPFGEEEK